MRWLAIGILVLILVIGIIHKLVGLMFALMMIGYNLVGFVLTVIALFLLIYILKNKKK